MDCSQLSSKQQATMGCTPLLFVASSLATTIDAAPSHIPDAFPAVTRPSGRNTDDNFARVSIVDVGLGCSSAVIISTYSFFFSLISLGQVWLVNLSELEVLDSIYETLPPNHGSALLLARLCNGSWNWPLLRGNELQRPRSDVRVLLLDDLEACPQMVSILADHDSPDCSNVWWYVCMLFLVVLRDLQG